MAQRSQPNSAPGTGRSKQLGALDLGSNSFHLLVAQETEGRIQVIDKHKETVRLAAGIDDNNELHNEVESRALDCLARLGQRLRSLDPANVRVVGTNTLRRIERDSDFISRGSALLGHPIEVISGHEEARLIFIGVCHDLGGDGQRRLVLDIGGGSTELIVGRHATAEHLESLHMGCVSMSQSYFPNGTISADAMQAAIRHAQLELEPVAQEFVDSGWDTCVGASGTINAVQAVIQADCGSDVITAEALAEAQDKVIAVEHIDKLELPGLANERRAVFAGGLAVLSAVFASLEIKSMSAAQSALREGLIYDLLGRQHHEDVRDRTVANLIERYHIDAGHARQVRDTALSLLSQVAMDWQLTNSEHKHLISWAADLHELGMDISHAGYHKHGGYLLENMDMPGFSRPEQQRLAHLVRFHRRKIVAPATNQPQQLIYLTVLLRVATLLHRSRNHEALPHISAKATEDSLELSLPDGWAHSHPLTMDDLQVEDEYLESLGLTLKVCGH
ncbi:MAG: exopolyphosphatase [Pseudomonadota bacterium]